MKLKKLVDKRKKKDVARNWRERNLRKEETYQYIMRMEKSKGIDKKKRGKNISK